MKRDEVVKKLSMYGILVVYEDALNLFSNGRGERLLIEIPDTETDQYGLPIEGNELKRLPKQDRAEILKIAYEYAATPYEEREDVQRFKVLVSPYNPWFESERYLHASSTDNGNGCDGHWYEATVFTPRSYADFLHKGSIWSSVLHPYDPTNTDLFIPVNSKGEQLYNETH